MPRFVTLLFTLLALVLAGCHVDAPPADARAVTVQGSLSNRFVRSDQTTPIAARLLIEARASERTARPPVNLALVVDTSGSMEGRAIDDARAASKALLAALRPKDRIAVVAFGSTTEVLLPSTPIEDADIAKLSQSIDAMRAFGTTDLAGGLRAGMEEVKKSFSPEGVNRVILLGDGDPNDARPVKQIAARAGEHGISITAKRGAAHQGADREAERSGHGGAGRLQGPRHQRSQWRRRDGHGRQERVKPTSPR